MPPDQVDVKVARARGSSRECARSTTYTVVAQEVGYRGGQGSSSERRQGSWANFDEAESDVEYNNMDSANGQIPARTWLDPRVALRASPRGGYGLFATAPIHAGEIVIIWGGASYTDEAGAQEAMHSGKAVMQWDSQVYSVETDDDDAAFKINHGCDPNIWMQDAFTIVARADIAAGVELLADYALWETSDEYVASWECHCGSPLCRGRITGRDWRLPELRERYRGHFSPLLEKRIAQAYGSPQ